MTRLTWIRFALGVIGIVVWAYGYRADDPSIRWVGIAVLALAVILRFWARPSPPPPV